jgi:hypothetical protein
MVGSVALAFDSIEGGNVSVVCLQIDVRSEVMLLSLTRAPLTKGRVVLE